MKRSPVFSPTIAGALAIALGGGLAASPGLQAGQGTLKAAIPADLALHGPLHIGDKEIEWGGIIALRRTDAQTYEQGRCTFSYRYRVANLGQGGAAAHVNRLRLDPSPVLAENGLPGLAASQSRVQTGTFTLWSGEHVVYVELDADQQVIDGDRGNNLRRVGVNVAPGCADPRPQARPPREPGSSEPIRPTPPTARKKEPPAPTGSRAPAPQGKPASQGRPAQPGSTSKPIPPGSAQCRPMLSATRTAAATRVGAMATATAAWEASAFSLHGGGYRWHAAQDQSTECKFGLGWACTVKARPCK